MRLNFWNYPHALFYLCILRWHDDAFDDRSKKSDTIPNVFDDFLACRSEYRAGKGKDEEKRQIKRLRNQLVSEDLESGSSLEFAGLGLWAGWLAEAFLGQAQASYLRLPPFLKGGI